jgi:hypothetical protein
MNFIEPITTTALIQGNISMLHISRISHLINSAQHTTARNRREYRQKDLRWDDQRLRLNSGWLLATIEFDSKYPQMRRVRLPDGHLTDTVNLTRAKDAAICLALANLNRHAGPAGASPVHSFPEAASHPLGCGTPSPEPRS